MSNLELSETAVALGRTRKDLEDEGNYESDAVADLMRDRVADAGGGELGSIPSHTGLYGPDGVFPMDTTVEGRVCS